ncbi:MAG TPA: FecR domain-containing protein [Stellaceae bacterium]|nr:FecR domain-containing protein [Stellaceae bacterium]
MMVAALGPARAEGIGQTVIVVRTVTGTLETEVRQLVIHDDVAQNELITTAPDAASEIEFVDGTKLRLGPRARVVLDKFVYDPDPSKGAFFLSVSEGVFRFATGRMAHQDYTIKTPNGTLGVRGTSFNFTVLNDKTIVQIVDGEVFGSSADGQPKSYGRGSYFTMINSTDPSSSDDKSTIDALVAMMDALIGGNFALLLRSTPETHPFQPFPVSPTLR